MIVWLKKLEKVNKRRKVNMEQSDIADGDLPGNPTFICYPYALVKWATLHVMERLSLTCSSHQRSVGQTDPRGKDERFHGNFLDFAVAPLMSGNLNTTCYTASNLTKECEKSFTANTEIGKQHRSTCVRNTVCEEVQSSRSCMMKACLQASGCWRR